jgi:hypothetical protein
MSGFADRADTAYPAIGFTTTLPSASGRAPMPAVLNGFSRETDRFEPARDAV